MDMRKDAAVALYQRGVTEHSMYSCISAAG